MLRHSSLPLRCALSQPLQFFDLHQPDSIEWERILMPESRMLARSSAGAHVAVSTCRDLAVFDRGSPVLGRPRAMAHHCPGIE